MASLEEIAKRAQDCYSRSPVVILGSGFSAPFGLPLMSDLAQYLRQHVVPPDSQAEDQWLLIRTALDAGDHLEQALTGKQLSTQLVDQIVHHTWELVGAREAVLLESAIRGQVSFPIAQLFQGLLETSNYKVDVVTTNYDRIVEFSAEHSGLLCLAGSFPSYLSPLEGNVPQLLDASRKPWPRIEVWKVHGSMDWFRRSDGSLWKAPYFKNLPEDVAPVIVTPGVSKYERIVDEPFRSTMQGMDAALNSAKSFVCFGFGFRDRQLEPKIIQRVNKKSVPIVVATRTLTEEATSFLKTHASDFVALESEGDKTRARTSENWDGTLLSGDYWSVSGFLKLVQ